MGMGPNPRYSAPEHRLASQCPLVQLDLDADALSQEYELMAALCGREMCLERTHA